ncbi:MATE family efflux transporter [Clostridium lundense]|uniref:MATE family efflux transporter n=1 Tax=Clostridium lundense TaxID=319475 RepID=UPI00047FFFE1|nr:MATE family efflux transporter [Clostridium lundense]
MKQNNVLKEVIDISLPVIAEMIAYNFMNIFDIMIIGNFGGSSMVSAVALSNEIIDTFYNIVISSALGISVTSLIARSTGRRDLISAKEYAFIGMKIGIIFSTIIGSVLYIFSNEILHFFKAYGRVLEYGDIYIKIIAISLLPSLFVNILNSILRGIGNTITPFKVSIIISVSKVFFDFILVFGVVFKNLGIKGAAIATLISQFIGAIYLFLYVIKNFDIFDIRVKFKIKSSYKKVKRILFIAIPCFFEEASYSISRLICTSMIMGLGAASVAANQIANNIEGLSVMPSVGIGIAATTLVGIKVGERDLKGARKYAYQCSLLSLGMISFFFILFITMPNLLAEMFIKGGETQVINLTAACLLIGSIEQPFIAISNVFCGSLKGMGDAKVPFIISLISGWFIRLPLTFYFIYCLKKPVTYIWWITNLQWGVDGILMYIFFRKKFKNYRSNY